MSILLGVGAGGKGDFSSFFSFFGALRFLMFFFLNLGRKRSHDSFFSAGSYEEGE